MTNPIKKGTILRFTKEATVAGITFPEHHKMRVHKAGKNYEFICINPHNSSETFVLTMGGVPSYLAPCNEPVLPLGITAKIKHHAGLSQGSMALTGHLIYDGVKLDVSCRGCGDAIDVRGYGKDQAKADELEAALKAHLLADGFEGANQQNFSVFERLVEYIFSHQYGLESFASQVKREFAEFQKMLEAS